MTDQQIRELYEAGVCPGCDAPLKAVAGVSHGHYLPGQHVAKGGGSYWRTTQLGEICAARGIPANDPRVCPWDANMLAGLMHLGWKLTHQ